MSARDGVDLGDYIYDEGGQRAFKVVNGETTIFLYDQHGLLLSEALPDGSALYDYIYLSAEPVAKGDDSVLSYIHTDHLGTPVTMTDGSAGEVWGLEALPFGDAQTTTGTATLELRFLGQYYDSETNLHYNYHRYYDPGTGRYITADPSHSIQPLARNIPFLVSALLTAPQELGNYAYVRNNPVNSRDPRGLISFYGICLPNECFDPPRLPSNSPECDKYGEEKYAGTHLRCFCKCAGDGDWSKYVRGCLRCMEKNNVNRMASHVFCYGAASEQGYDRPETAITFCYTWCLWTNDYPVEKK